MQEEDTSIVERLLAPSKRHDPPTSVTNMVRRHYADIRSSRMAPLAQRKTWDEIGRDLRPHNPVPGATVGRLYARVTIEMAVKVEESAKRSSRAGAQPARIAPIVSPVPRNPFAKATDPIRLISPEEI